MSSSNPGLWRISLTEAGLDRGSYLNYQLPAPTVCEYRPFSAERAQSDGGQSLHGYATVELLFEGLSAAQVYVLRKMIDDARDGSGYLYLTIDKGDGSAPGPAWIDVYGRPWRQADLNQGRIQGRTGPALYQNVKVRLNNVIVVNDPSAYSEA